MQTRMEQFPATNPNPVISAGKDGIVLYSNMAGEPLLHEWGVSVGEKLPLQIENIVQRTISLRSPEKIEVKAGNHVYLVSFHPLPEEMSVNIYGFDISEQKELEVKLREREEQYRAFFENSIDAVFLTSPDGAIYAANPQACRIFGMTEDEIIRVGRKGVVDTSDPRLQSVLEERDRTGKFKGELNHKRKDGTIFPAEVSTLFFTDRNGFVKTSTFIRDITERKRAEEALREAYENLQLQSEELQAQSEELQVQNEELQVQSEELNEAYETLHESEKRYRMLFDKSMDGIILSDPRGVGIVLSANPAACKMLGWTEEELILKGLDVIFDVKNPALSTLLDEHISSGSAKSQVNYRRKDGTTLNGEISSTFFIDRNGEPRAVSIIRDITERKRVEQALRESEEKYRNIVETTNEGIWVSDATGRTTFVNERMARMVGHSREELVGKYGWDFADEEGEAISKQNFENRRQGINGVHEFKFIHKDGSLLWALVNSQYLTDSNGKFIGVLAMLTDITERKQAEEALRENEEKYRLLIEYAPSAIYEIDFIEQRFISVNEGVCKMLGCTEAELMTMSPMDILDEGSRGVFLDRVRKAQAGEPLADYIEYKAKRKDGSDIWGILHPRFRYSNGQIVGAFVIAHDITERRQMEEALRVAYENLQVKSEELQAQSEELQMQNVELQVQSEKLHEANEALGESEKKYHLLFENMLDGFAYCKMLYDDCGHPVDFIYLDTNIAFERLTGLKGVKGKRITEIIPGIKELHPELLDIYGRVAMTGQPESIDIEFKPLGLWLSISVYSTEREHFVAVFDNITECKQAEEALRASENRFRTLAENSPDVIARFDRQNRHIYVNPAAEPYGHSQEEVIGKTHTELGMDSKLIKFWESHHENVFATCEPETMEFQHISSRGEEYYFNTRIVPEFVDGKVNSVLAISRDITDIKKTEIS